MAKRYTIAIAVVTSGVKKSSKNIRELGGAGATAAKGINLVKTAAVGIGALMASEMAQAGMALESLKSRLKDPEAFNTLNQFAKDTGQAVENVVNGYIKLRNLGIDPTMERMRAFGNVAAAQGKSLEQFVEAVADAATNEFERLKEFGIKTRQEADSVVFTFQGVQTRVGKNSDAIVGYLEDIGNVDFAGELERQAKTTEGQLESLRGELKDLAGAFWDNGMKQATGAFVRALTEVVKKANETVDILADDSDGLTGRLRGVRDIIAAISNPAAFGIKIAEGMNAAADETKVVVKELGRYVETQGEVIAGIEQAAKAEAERLEVLEEERRVAKELADSREKLLEGLQLENEELERNIGLLKTQYELYGSSPSFVEGQSLPQFGGTDEPFVLPDEYVDGLTESLGITQDIGREWEGIAYTVADMIVDLTDGTADWIDYLNYAVDLWGQIASAAAQSQGGSYGGGGGTSASDAAGAASSWSQAGSSLGYVNAAIAIYTAVYEAVDAMIERDKAKIYGLPITTGGVGLSAYGGQAIASNGQSTLETAEISEGLRRGFEAILDVIGGFVTDIDEFGIQIQASGDKFRAVVGDYVLGSFDTIQQAIEQATKYALKTATYEGIGENMAAALRNSTAQTMQGFLEDLELGRWVDELGMSDLEVQIASMSRTFLRAAEDARRLGMDVGAISDGFLREMGSIRDRILGIHKSEYEQRLDDAEAYNRQIQERIEQLRRYLAELQGGAYGALGGSGPQAGGATGGPGAPNGPDGAAGALDRFAASVANVGMVATTVANEAVDPAVQAILDEIAALQALVINPDEVKRGGGGGGGTRREEIKRFREEIERLARAAGGPVTEALFAVNDNFDRLEEEARRLRQPLDEIVALREREVEALKEQARNDFTEGYLGFINNWGEIEQAMVDFGQQANAVRDQIDDLLEAGVINAEQAAALLDEVQAAQNSKFGAYVQDYANSTLLQLYDYLGDEEASAKLRWELAQAEMEMRLAQLEIAREQGHLSADTLAYIREQWAAVLASGVNPMDPDSGTGGSGGDSGGGTGSSADPFREALARLGATEFRSVEDLLSAWAAFTTEFKHNLSGSRLTDAEEVFAGAVDAIEEVLVQPIRDLRDEILADELGPLSARERFERMQAEYRDVVARAQGGDLAAIQEYEQVARQFRAVYQEFYGNAAAGFLDAQILAMIKQLEGLDLTGDLNFPGHPIIDAELGPGGPVNAGTRMMVETIDMHGTDTVSELRTLNRRMERIERHVRDGSLHMNRWQRTGTRG